VERQLQTWLKVATDNFLGDSIRDSWNAQRARTAIYRAGSGNLDRRIGGVSA
jgi:hypothetical protein